MTEIILTSSVLILLLIILRRGLRGRISPGVQYALWLLVAARLLVPGTLFAAPVSVMGAAVELQSSVRQSFPDAFPDPDTPDSSPAPSLTGLLPENPLPVFGTVDITGIRDADISDFKELDTRERNTRSWADLIWKIGIAATGGAMSVSNLVFYLQLRKNRKRLDLSASPWAGNLRVYQSNGLPSPCLFGFLRPAVYLNHAAMCAEHPEHILAHEYAHYRHGDHLWSILRCVCVAVHWYNPLVWWAAALCRQDCELACDAAVLKELGGDGRIDYGQTLLSMISKGRNPAALLQTATTMTAGKHAMKERIALIVKQPRMKKITLLLVSLLACLLAACSFGGKADTEFPAEYFGSYALEYWSGGGMPPALRYDTSIHIEVREDYFGFVDEQGMPVEQEASGLVSVPSPVYTKQNFSLSELMRGHGIWSDYLQDKNSVDFYDVSSVDGASVAELAIVDGQLILNYQAEGEPGLFYFLNAYTPANPGVPEIPVNVSVGQLASSNLNDSSLITDPDEVKRLWELYQSFEYEGTYDPWGKGGWPIGVRFRFRDGPDIFFILAQDGIYTEDDENLLLKDIDKIYTEFYRMSTSNPSTPATAEPETTAPADLDPGQEILMENARSIVEHIQSGADAGEWLPLMNYMNWQLVYKAMADAGGYTDEELDPIMSVMDEIEQYIDRQLSDLTMAEYLYVLTATEGLDGAYSQRYAYLVYRMYAVNPSQFAFMVLNMLPEPQRTDVLDYFRGEWYYHRISDSPDIPTREEAVAQLESDLSVDVRASPSEMTLHSAGDSFPFQMVNAAGTYAVTYESSDPGVAAVDENGVVTAVGPGTAVVSLHYEGPGGPWDFGCEVYCDW